MFFFKGIRIVAGSSFSINKTKQKFTVGVCLHGVPTNMQMKVTLTDIKV